MIINPPILTSLSPIVGIDLETSGVNPWEHDILLISITNSLGQTYVLETKKYTHERLVDIFERLQKTSLVIGQNIKFDVGFIFIKYGVLLHKVWDTMLVSQICTNGKPFRYTLPEIINRELGIPTIDTDMKKYYQKSFIGMRPDSIFTKAQLEYAASDTHYLLDLYKVQKENVERLGLDNIVKLEHKLLPVLTKMEVTGCRINVDGWRDAINNQWDKTRLSYIEKLDGELLYVCENLNNKTIAKKYFGKPRKRAEFTAYDLFGENKTIVSETNCINYASSAQILDIFTILSLPLPTVKDGDKIKPSAGADALGIYITEYPTTPLRNFISLLLKFREYEKLLSTYGNSFLDQLDKDGYIHTTYSQCFTKTGRLSSRSPNLQNIPATDLKKDGYDIRQYFLADPGHVMITCDMQGAEVRIAADYSGEQKLIDSILKDEDLHSSLASKSFSIIFGEKVKIDKSDKVIEVGAFKFKSRELRDRHKSVLFAKFYKGGAKRVYEVLSEYINLYHQEKQLDIADKISKAIDKLLPKLSKYLTEQITIAQDMGELRGSKLGRVRYFDENVYGEAANYPIQNTNAEALKIAMINIDKYFVEKGFGRLVMNIHDEVVCSVEKEHAEEAAQFIKKTMAESLGWFLNIVPGDASVEINEHWKK